MALALVEVDDGAVAEGMEEGVWGEADEGVWRRGGGAVKGGVGVVPGVSELVVGAVAGAEEVAEGQLHGGGVVAGVVVPEPDVLGAVAEAGVVSEDVVGPGAFGVLDEALEAFERGLGPESGGRGCGWDARELSGADAVHDEGLVGVCVEPEGGGDESEAWDDEGVGAGADDGLHAGVEEVGGHGLEGVSLEGASAVAEVDVADEGEAGDACVGEGSGVVAGEVAVPVHDAGDGVSVDMDGGGAAMGGDGDAWGGHGEAVS